MKVMKKNLEVKVTIKRYFIAYPNSKLPNKLLIWIKIKNFRSMIEGIAGMKVSL